MRREELDRYVERRLDAARKRYGTYYDSIQSRTDLSAEDKQAHVAALWQVTNARTDELKRLRKFVESGGDGSD